MRFLPLLLSFSSVVAQIQTMASHEGPDCIVGATDPTKKSRVAVGGPCSALKEDKPTDDFRWIEMDTVYAVLMKKNSTDEAKFKELEYGQFSAKQTNYGETGVFLTQSLDSKTEGHAGLFLSTTSYLARKRFSMSTNDFRISKTATAPKMETCIVPCGEAGKGGACTESKCPTGRDIEVLPGYFKYSILAAPFDITTKMGDSAYEASKGWAGVKAKHGTEVAGKKQLEGELKVFQALDFTNMKTDTLTAIASDGKKTKFTDMATCDLTKGPCDKKISVAKIEMKATNFTQYLGFPGLYNVGEYTRGDTVTTSPTATKKVQIHAMRPDEATLAFIKRQTDSKILLIQYTFDLTGLDATDKTGTFMVYDPTVATKDAFTATGETKSEAEQKKSGEVAGAMAPRFMSVLAVLAASWTLL